MQLLYTSSNIVVITCNLSQLDLSSLGYSERSNAIDAVSLNCRIACDLQRSIVLHSVMPRRWAASHFLWFSTRVFAIAFSRCLMPRASFFVDFIIDGLSATAIEKSELFVDCWNLVYWAWTFFDTYIAPVRMNSSSTHFFPVYSSFLQICFDIFTYIRSTTPNSVPHCLLFFFV